MTNFEQISASLIDGQWKVIGEQVGKALAEGATPVQILDEVLIPSMGEVGRRFKEGEFYVPEVLIAAKAMHRAMEILKPRLVESNFEPVATVALGTVRGDLHDIGKNLVGMMMEGAGFEVVDLGIDVPPVRFVEAVRERPLQIVAMSALLTTTMAS
ncbi:MAG: B12-binding domain-containing protein, partial [Anaerolineae bacterium]